MPGPTIAELQLKLSAEGIEVLATLEKALKRVGSREINRQLNEEAKALLGIATAAEKAAAKAAAAQAKISSLDEALKRVGNRETKRKLDEQAKAILGIPTAAEKAAAKLAQLEAKNNTFASRFSRATDGIAKFGIAAMTIKRSFDFIGSSVKEAIDPLREFQSNLAQVRIKGQFSSAETSMIGEGIKERVRAGSMFTPQQQAQAGVDLAASGLNASTVNTMIPTVLRFAQASGISTVDSSKILTNVANQFGIRTNNPAAMEKLGDQIVGAANASTIGVMDIFNTLKYAGTLANTAKMDPAQILAMTAVMGNRGIVASKGGTGLRSILMSFSRPPRRGKEAAKQLAMLGMTQKDLQEGLANPEALLQRMGAEGRQRGLSPAKMLSIVSTAFGQYGSTSADVLMKALQGDVTGETFRKNIKADGKGGWVFDQNNAVTELEKKLRNMNGTMKEAAEIAGDTLDGKLAKLTSRMQLLQITLGERFMPTIERTVGWIDRMSGKFERWVSLNPHAVEQWNTLLQNLGSALVALQPPITWLIDKFNKIAGVALDMAANHDGQESLHDSFIRNYKNEHPMGSSASIDKLNVPEWQKWLMPTSTGLKALDVEAEEAWQSQQSKEKQRGMQADANASAMTGQSLVNVRVSVDDKGQIKAMVDRLTKGKDGPDLRTESSMSQ